MGIAVVISEYAALYLPRAFCHQENSLEGI